MKAIYRKNGYKTVFYAKDHRSKVSNISKLTFRVLDPFCNVLVGLKAQC